MKKRVAIAALSLAFLMMSVKLLPALRKVGRSDRHAPLSQIVDMIAGPGRVEPVSEDIQLGSELSGKLKIGQRAGRRIDSQRADSGSLAER